MPTLVAPHTQMVFASTGTARVTRRQPVRAAARSGRIPVLCQVEDLLLEGPGQADEQVGLVAMADGKGGKKYAINMATVGIWNSQGVMDEEFLFWDNQTFYQQIGLA
jgi:hypothetical protein